MYQVKFMKPLSLSGVSGKPPNVSKSKKSFSEYKVSSTVTISNDLGDEFFHGEATVIAELKRYSTKLKKGGEILRKEKLKWVAGNRSLNIIMIMSQDFIKAQDQICLEVSVNSQETVDETDKEGTTLKELQEQYLLEGREDNFSCCDTTSEKHIDTLRFLSIESKLLKVPNDAGLLPVTTERIAIRPLFDLLLEEELSGSIARHLWDAGILFSEIPFDELAEFMEIKSHSRIRNILELGTGIGLVSIHMSKMFPHSKVLATDLIDAKDICTRNILLNKVQSNVTFDELDWESEKSTGCDWDLILVTDCTYNPIYYDALLNVLKREMNSNTKLLLTHKFRERYTESELFDKISAVLSLRKQMWINARGHSLSHLGMYTIK